MAQNEDSKVWGWIDGGGWRDECLTCETPWCNHPLPVTWFRGARIRKDPNPELVVNALQGHLRSTLPGNLTAKRVQEWASNSEDG